jgi:hypothetical protein
MEAHLEGLDDIDYEACEAQEEQAAPPQMAPVKQEARDQPSEWSRWAFPTLECGHPDWSHNRYTDTRYVEPLR